MNDASNEEYFERFRKNLRQLREARGLSQKKLSIRCGFHGSYLGKVERGNKKPSFEVLTRIARELGVNPATFFNDPEVTRDLLAQLERKNAAEKNLLSAVFESFPHTVYLLDRECRVLTANQNALQRFGEALSEIQGKTLWNLTGWKKPHKLEQSLTDLLERAKYEDFTERRVRRDPEGNETTQKIVITPVNGDKTWIQYLIVKMSETEEALTQV